MRTPPVAPPPEDEPPDALPEIGPGLTFSIIEKALRRGRFAADFITRNNPSNGSGMTRWIAEVGSLRTDLKAVGWTCADNWNVPQIWTPDGSAAIITRPGNGFTGTYDGGTLQPARKIGRRLRAILQPESFQGDLFLPQPQVVRRPNVYLLLHHHCVDLKRGIDEIRVELARPLEISAKGWVTKWKFRLRLPNIDLNHEPTTGREDDDESDEDFDVRRRNA